MPDWLESRRAAVASLWGLTDEVVLIPAGTTTLVPGTDLHQDFRAHPEHRYLADSDRPDHVLAFDPLEGWTLFVPEVEPEALVWERPDVAEGAPISGLRAWIDARRGRPVANLGAPLAGIGSDAELRRSLRNGLDAARRVKDAEELRRIRSAVSATAAGFEAAVRAARPGATERRVAVELEAAFLRAGASRPAFSSVVASGPNAAVLHFAPSARELRKGELVLLDAGAECEGYASDVTRTFVSGGRPTREQRDLHQLVREVQATAIAACRPGVEYREIHLEACLGIARGLVDLGLLRGAPEALVERDAHALFFPHGLGHLMGLAVHDAGGYLPGRERSDRFGLCFLRTDLPLEPGHVVTIEPGIYFIEALLQDEERRERYADDVDWKRAERLLPLGGIRIEDDILVTPDGPEILTAAIPKRLG
jgi:Xaa-Pro aminopeptidase